jgi:uncharacterized delta-60 repeat protein
MNLYCLNSRSAQRLALAVVLLTSALSVQGGEYACNALSAATMSGKTVWFSPLESGFLAFPGFEGRGYQKVVLAAGTYSVTATNQAYACAGTWSATNGASGPFTWVDIWLIGFPEPGVSSKLGLFNFCTFELERFYPVFANMYEGRYRVTDGESPTPRPPTNVSVVGGGTVVGGTVTLTALASGDTPFTYTWSKTGGIIAGATGNSFVITNVQLSDSDIYSVTVANAYGTNSASLAITILDGAAPKIDQDPFSYTRTAGQSVTLRTLASGTEPLAYQWFKNSQPVSGGTSGQLRFDSLAGADAGEYFAVVTNLFGAATSQVATLVVEIPNPPVITSFSTDTNVLYGDTVELLVTATGEAPLSYLWRKGGQPVLLSSYVSNNIVYSVYPTEPVFRQTNYTGAGLGAPYDVVVSNRWGAVTSSPPAWIHVFSNAKPFINSGGLFTRMPGDTVQFEFTSSDLPPFTWGVLRNGVPLTDPKAGFTSGFTNDASHTTHFFLTLPNLTGADAGNYQPWVSNRFGAFTNSFAATLKIVSSNPPAIITPPAGQAVGVGATVALTTAWEYNPDGGAGGIEWYSNSVRVASQAGLGQTINGFLYYNNTYQTTLLTAGAANFQVVVTNLFGRTTSAVAQVTATLLPGSLDASFDSSGTVPAGGNVAVVQPLPDGTALVGGGFTTINGQPRAKLARYLANGTLDAGWVAASNLLSGSGEVKVLQRLSDGKILVGGGFSATQGGLRHDNFLRLNADGSLDTSFGSGWSNTGSPAINGEVHSISLQPNGQIVVSGAFSSVLGTTIRGIARFSSGGVLDAGFTSPLTTISATTPIRATAVRADGKIWIGGSFTGLGSPARSYLARLLDNGALDTSVTNYSITSGRAVYALQLQPDGKLVVAGSFSIIGGKTYRGVARLTADGAVDTRSDPISGEVSALPGVNVSSSRYPQALALRPNGGVAIGGGFNNGGDANRNYLYASKPDGTVDEFPPLGAGPNADVRSLAVGTDGAVWIAGYFTSVGAVTARGVAKLAPDAPSAPTPPLLSAVSFGGGSLGFNIPTVPGTSYRIEYKTNLTDSGWQLYTSFVATGSAQSVTIPTARASQFFRMGSP